MLHGLVQGGVVNADAGPFTHLQLDTFQHQAVKYLRLQLVFRRQLGAVPPAEAMDGRVRELRRVARRNCARRRYRLKHVE